MVTGCIPRSLTAVMLMVSEPVVENVPLASMEVALQAPEAESVMTHPISSMIVLSSMEALNT